MLKDLVSRWKAARAEAYYEECLAVRVSRWRMFRASVRNFVNDLRTALYCRRHGHEYEVEADVENGTEDGFCVRCGDGFHAQF